MNRFLEGYYAFSVVFVTIILLIMFGFFIYGFIQGVSGWFRRERHARQSRRYLNEVIGRIEKVEETKDGLIIHSMFTPEGAEMVRSGSVTGLSIGYSIDE